MKQVINKYMGIIIGLMTHDNIRTATRIINTTVLIAIMIIALVLLAVIKEQLPKIGQSTAAVSAEMFDMNTAVTGYVMTGQIGEYIYNQGAQNDKY